MELAQWITELSTNLAVEKLTFVAEEKNRGLFQSRDLLSEP